MTVMILSKITGNPWCAAPPRFCQSRTKFLSGKNFSSDTLLKWNLVLSHTAVKVQHICCYRSLDWSDLLRFADATKIDFWARFLAQIRISCLLLTPTRPEVPRAWLFLKLTDIYLNAVWLESRGRGKTSSIGFWVWWFTTAVSGII